ncbi:MAG: hypothetical protein GEV06_09805 [Luteitalea sp.]|nr:hypothetical protein [Luteitalea sp.]
MVLSARHLPALRRSYGLGLLWVPFACSLLVLLLLPTGSTAEGLPMRTFSRAQGVASNRVLRIVRDPKGFLWFCTANGVSRFDGSRFTTYGPDQGLPFSVVNDLLITRDGRYLIASNGVGVITFDVSSRPDAARSRQRSAPPSGTHAWRFRAHPVSEQAQSNRVNVLLEDRQGQVWVGTDGGLFVLNDLREPLRPTRVSLVERPRDWSIRVFALVEDREGSLWIGSGAGLTRRLPDGDLVRYRWPADIGHVWALTRDAAGRLWIGHDHGLSVIMPEPAASLNVKNDLVTLRVGDRSAKDGAIVLPTRPGEAQTWSGGVHHIPTAVFALALARDGHVWISGFNRLVEFDGRTFRSHEIPFLLSWSDVAGVIQDDDGHIWAGTLANGAMRFARNGFQPFTEPQGASGLRGPLFETRDGRLCARALGAFLGCLDGDRFVVTGRQSWEQRDILEDRTGQWWVATSHGLHRFPASARLADLPQTRPLRSYDTRDGLPNDDVTQLYEDARGDIWISPFQVGHRVLARWERTTDRLVIYSDADGLPAFDTPMNFAEDHSGTLWVGLRAGGLVRYRNGRFTVFGQRHGIPAGYTSLYVDRSGRLWVAGNIGGVLRIDRPDGVPLRGTRYTTAQGLTTNQVYDVTEDTFGRIYFATAQGVNRLNPTTGHIRRYTESDGLASDEVANAFRDRRGALWFGSASSGLTRYVPTPDPPTRAPAVAIDRTLVDDRAVPLSVLGEAAVVLGVIPGAGPLQIDVVGSSFRTGGQVRYQYKLEGADEEWSPPTDRRSVRYARLAPGSYRFLTRAVTADGVVSARPASVTFRILPPIWLRWWFLVLGALAIAALAVVVHRYRVSRLVELERVRVRIATDLHDDIGSNLSKVALLSGVTSQQVAQKSPEVAERLSSIANISQESVDAMSDIVWAIDPTKDRLHDLVLRMRRFASDVFTAREIALRFVAPASDEDLPLSTDVRRELFLIFKEAVNNVIRHAACTTAEIDLRIHAGSVALAIRDDGKGFCLEQEACEGNGLTSMERRARALDGELEVASSPGTGTCVKVTVPIRRHGRRRGALHKGGRREKLHISSKTKTADPGAVTPSAAVTAEPPARSRDDAMPAPPRRATSPQ